MASGDAQAGAPLANPNAETSRPPGGGVGVSGGGGAHAGGASNSGSAAPGAAAAASGASAGGISLGPSAAALAFRGATRAAALADVHVELGALGPSDRGG